MNNRRIITILTIVLISMIILAGCEASSTVTNFPEDNLLMHFIDVGQGDSTLIMFPNNEIALIDAGTRGGRKDLVKYLQDLKIKKIDHLIGTHPHEDHIGGLPEVIRNFEIGKVYLPNKTSNTAIFEELLNEIKDNNLKISEGKTGVSIIDSGDLKFYIIAPSKEYTNINNNSVVTKIIYKDFSAIITGDAEKEAESDIIKEGHNLKASILRVGHHGSSTSSMEEFLDEVNPEYAVISLGEVNTYSHPDKEVIKLLENRNIPILRTDELGSIVFQTDGKEINLINKVDGSKVVKNIEDVKNEEDIYIGNINSKTLHTGGCNSLPDKENQIVFSSKEKALKEGYKPHSVCIK